MDDAVFDMFWGDHHIVVSQYAGTSYFVGSSDTACFYQKGLEDYPEVHHLHAPRVDYGVDVCSICKRVFCNSHLLGNGFLSDIG